MNVRVFAAAVALAASLAAGRRVASGDELARKSGGKESYSGIAVDYGSVSGPAGTRLRTIVTRPSGAERPLPALFLVGWLSCDSVEAPASARGSIPAMLRGLAAQSGMLFVRVDKPGVGDSEGVCGDTDFAAELAGYRAAFRQLLSRPDVDRARVFVFGWSNGAGVAPLVPEGAPVAGYVVSGGWVRTWYEHMLEYERRQMTLSGKSPGEINDAMKKEEELYDLYLNRSMTPGAVLEARPDLASVWADEPERQYGRPSRFYQQLQKLNLEGVWSAVDAPVLSIHGEYDSIMGREDNERIPAIVNARHPGYGTFVERPRMDHVFGLHVSAAEGMTRMGEGRFDEKALTTILDWLRAHSR